METTTQKNIRLINKKIEALDAVQTENQFYSWRDSTVVILESLFNSTDKGIVNFQRINATLLYSNDNIVHQAKQEAKEFLLTIIDNIEANGIPKYNEVRNQNDNKNINNISINNQNHQEQSQSQEVTVLLQRIYEAIDQELTGKQRNELKSIIISDEKPEIKNSNFVTKLKEFGNDVASNIVANLLTNPGVYSGISNMF